jgi:guanylate kinase
MKLVFLVAPTASGHSTLISQLLKTGKYHFIVSDTTRYPRRNDGKLEQNGREYWFRSETEMIDDLKQGLYLAPAIIHHQQVSGISLRELQKARSDNKIPLASVNFIGAEAVNSLTANVKFIFILPPNFLTWLSRLEQRGGIPAVEIYRRLESAHAELRNALTRPYYHFVVNDNLALATRQTIAIITGGYVDDRQQALDRGLAQQLSEELNNYLAGHHKHAV